MLTYLKKPPAFALCDNPMLFRLSSSLGSEYTLIVVYIDPYYSTGNVYLGRDALFLVPNGYGDIDLGEYLRTGLQTTRQFHFPEQGNIPWTIRTGLSLQYKIRTDETCADPEFTLVAWLEQRWVLKGGIPLWKKAAFYNQWNSFYEYVTTTGAFMTFSPSTLFTTTEMIQKLYYLVYFAPDGGTALTLDIGIQMTDGKNYSLTPAQQTAEVSKYDVVEFSVGYSILGLASWLAVYHPTSIIEYYTVTVMDGETAVSQTRTYYLDYQIPLASHQFIFANSLPGYDTFMATGISELNTEFEFTQVDQASPDLLELPDKRTAFVKATDVVTARSGNLTAEYVQYLAEFFLSKEVYEVLPSGLVPIVFVEVNVLRARDVTNVFNVEFKYQYAVNQFVESVNP